jgi:hypothetical protein
MTKLIKMLVLAGIVSLAGVASASTSGISPNRDRHGRGNGRGPYTTVPEPSDLLMLATGVSLVIGLRRRSSLSK